MYFSSTNWQTCRRRGTASSECWEPSLPPTSSRKSSPSPSRYTHVHHMLQTFLLFLTVTEEEEDVSLGNFCTKQCSYNRVGQKWVLKLNKLAFLTSGSLRIKVDVYLKVFLLRTLEISSVVNTSWRDFNVWFFGIKYVSKYPIGK